MIVGCPNIAGSQCPRAIGRCRGLDDPTHCPRAVDWAIRHPPLDPGARDRVNACEHRGPEGGLIPTEDEADCCGGGPELTRCDLGKGARSGRVTLRECLSCRARA